MFINNSTGLRQVVPYFFVLYLNVQSDDRNWAKHRENAGKIGIIAYILYRTKTALFLYSHLMNLMNMI